MREKKTDPYVPSPICSNFSKQSTLLEPHEGDSFTLSCPGAAIAITTPRKTLEALLLPPAKKKKRKEKKRKERTERESKEGVCWSE